MTEASPTIIYGDHTLEGRRKVKAGCSLESWSQKTQSTLLDFSVASASVWGNVLLLTLQLVTPPEHQDRELSAH